MNQAASATSRSPAGSTATAGCCPMFNAPYYMNTFAPQAPLIQPVNQQQAAPGQTQQPLSQRPQDQPNATNNNNNYNTSTTTPSLTLQHLFSSQHPASSCMALAAALATVGFPHFQHQQQLAQNHQTTPINQPTNLTASNSTTTLTNQVPILNYSQPFLNLPTPAVPPVTAHLNLPISAVPPATAHLNSTTNIYHQQQQQQQHPHPHPHPQPQPQPQPQQPQTNSISNAIQTPAQNSVAPAIPPMPFYSFPQMEQAIQLLTDPQVANNIFRHVFSLYLQSGLRTEPHTHHHHHTQNHFHSHMHGSHHHHPQHGPNGQGNGQDATMPLDSLAISESKPRGLNRAEIDSLQPYIHMNEKDCRTCVICLSKFELKSKIRPLPCNHAFHAKCVDKWLRANRTCPICRRDALRAYNAKIKRI